MSNAHSPVDPTISILYWFSICVAEIHRSSDVIRLAAMQPIIPPAPENLANPSVNKMLIEFIVSKYG